MAYIFGSNWDALAQQENYRNSQALELSERDRALRQRAIEQSQENYRFTQQMAARDAERQAALEERRFSTALGLGEQRRQERREDYRFNLGQQERESARKEDARRYEAGVLFDKDKLKSSEGRQQLAELVGMAAKGVIPDDADMGSLFPSLKPTQIQWAKKFAMSDKESQNKELERVADEATRLVKARQFEEMKDPQLSARYRTAPLTQILSGNIPIQSREAESQIVNDADLREWSALLQWDDNSQRFTPLGVSQAAASPYPFAPTNAPSAVTNFPSPVAPTAGIAPYDFTNQPVALPSMSRPSPMVSPRLNGPVVASAGPMLRVGQVHKGYRYLGGAPGNKENWQKISD